MPRQAKRYAHARTAKVFQTPAINHHWMYGYRWQKYTAYFKKRFPLCERCKTKGLKRPAEVVDHVVPHKGDYETFWNKDNHCSLCKACHDEVTVLYDGGLGRSIKPKPRYRIGETD